MAPILSFTAEEAWEVLNPGSDDSIFFHTWNDVLPPQDGEAELSARWKRIRELRAVVVKKLEESRTAGAIGSSLQAEVVIETSMADRDLLRSLGDDLKFVLITSQAAVSDETDEGLTSVTVKPSSYAKCDRCWHWRADVGSNPKYATICGRCAKNLEGPGEDRRHA